MQRDWREEWYLQDQKNGDRSETNSTFVLGATSVTALVTDGLEYLRFECYFSDCTCDKFSVNAVLTGD